MTSPSQFPDWPDSLAFSGHVVQCECAEHLDAGCDHVVIEIKAGMVQEGYRVLVGGEEPEDEEAGGTCSQ